MPPQKFRTEKRPGKLTTSAAPPDSTSYEKHWHKHRSARQTPAIRSAREAESSSVVRLWQSQNP